MMVKIVCSCIIFFVGIHISVAGDQVIEEQGKGAPHHPKPGTKIDPSTTFKLLIHDYNMIISHSSLPTN